MPGSQVLKSIKKTVYHIILQAHSNPPPRLLLKNARLSPSVGQRGSRARPFPGPARSAGRGRRAVSTSPPLPGTCAELSISLPL